jgi:cytosine/adenosine deaminase-related metal-dependent hydrolase
MEREKIYSGTGFIGDPPETRPVTIVVCDGIITHVEEEKAAADRWISPAFFNAHTHLADTVAMDLPCSGNLEELVSPPHGLKHRILSKTPPCQLIYAMKTSISEMISTGIAGFADFREGGVSGVRYLQDAARGLSCRPVILGRGGGEMISDGAGISSTRDTGSWEETAARMKSEGKLVAFHAGEKDSSDIDDALACDPDFLVHCTHATPHQLRTIADAGIPVVICPRSNFLLGVTRSAAHPPVQEMINQGVPLFLGTDNAMFVNPDIMQEISFCHTVYGIAPEDLFAFSTRGFPPAGINHAIEPGNKANFFIMDISKSNLVFSHDPLKSMVKRSPSCRICTTIFYM